MYDIFLDSGEEAGDEFRKNALDANDDSPCYSVENDELFA